MTVEKPFIRYLSREDIRDIHGTLYEWAKINGEPIPSFGLADQDAIDAMVASPQHSFSGNEVYPSIEEKAAILFYTVNKRQMFANGNKRMSTLCLLVFLGLNGKMLDVPPDELTAKALWLANTRSSDFQEIKSELVDWLRSSVRMMND